MLERLLAIRYIRAQKRHSILTACSIAIAVALMTILFTALATYEGIARDAAYREAPYHYKLLRLNEEDIAVLQACPDFKEVRRVVEDDYTLSAELLVKTYHDDQGKFLNALLPDKGLYDGWRFNDDLVWWNEQLIELDRIDLQGRYRAIQSIAVFYVFVLFLIMALRLIIDTAFEVSSRERERQFGVLQSIGATPAQIVRIITFEGLTLCIIGIPAGILLGLGLSFAVFQAILSTGISEVLFTAEQAEALMHLHISPLLLGIGALTGLVWVLLSAYATGMRVVKMSPIEAITGKHAKVRRVRRRPLLGLLFGWQGKLASRNNHRQPKRYVITILSLTLSIALFSSFTMILDQVQATYEEGLSDDIFQYDMSLCIRSVDDPLGYRKGLDLLRKSGYFDITGFSKTQICNLEEPDGKQPLGFIIYFAPETYAEQFEGEPPLSYEELSAQGGYLLIRPDGQSDTGIVSRYEGISPLPVLLQTYRIVPEEEATSLTEEERQEQRIESLGDGEGNIIYQQELRVPAELNVLGTGIERHIEEVEYSDMRESFFMLYSTLDVYESVAYALVGDNIHNVGVTEEPVYVKLRNEGDYSKAKQFLGLNSGILTISEDWFGEKLQIRTVISAIRIGCGFLSVLIGLIAAVNLINILSTGVLNRKSELAAMQCLGMTRGQLYGMTIIECLQYALTAAVGATLLVELLMLATQGFLQSVMMGEEFQTMFHYGEPLPRIWLASLAAFLAALAASLIPLQQMQKESLTEQIRSVE